MVKKHTQIIFFLSSISLIISFFFNEDGHGYGASNDFKATWGFVKALSITNLFNLDPSTWTLHFPLHYYFLSLIDLLINNDFLLRLIFCIFSIFTPILFFKIFRKFKSNYDLNIVLILSSAILFIPAFRYTAIWANDNITASIFFLLSIFFFLKWKKNSENDIKIIFIQIFFLFLASYTRQYYSVFIIYFFFNYINYISVKNFFILFFYCIILSLPGLFYLYKFPDLFFGLSKSTNLYNSLLSNSAMLSVYLAPIFFINLIYNKKILFNKATIYSLICSLALVFYLSINFNPKNWEIGGGIPYMVSVNIFNSNIPFYLCSLFSFLFLFLIARENKNNLILILIILFIFSSNYMFQRYFEPLFYIISFLLFNTKYFEVLRMKNKSSIIILIYYLVYYLFSSSEILYLF